MRDSLLIEEMGEVAATGMCTRPEAIIAAACTIAGPILPAISGWADQKRRGRGFIASTATGGGSASAGGAEGPPADMTIGSLQVKLEGGARTRSPSLTLSHSRPYGQHPADPFIADDGGKRGAECVDAVC